MSQQVPVSYLSAQVSQVCGDIVRKNNWVFDPRNSISLRQKTLAWIHGLKSI